MLETTPAASTGPAMVKSLAQVPRHKLFRAELDGRRGNGAFAKPVIGTSVPAPQKAAALS